MNPQQKYWYVAVTYRKERIIKRELDKCKCETFCRCVGYSKKSTERKNGCGSW